jgi:hypothetical protein
MDGMSDMKRNPHERAVLFRGVISRKKRRLDALGFYLCMAAITGVGMSVAVLSGPKESEPRNLAASMVLLFAVMALPPVMMWLAPFGRLLRLDDRGIVLTRRPRGHPRRMRWDDVRRVQWRSNFVDVRSEVAKITLCAPEWSPDDWGMVKTRMQEHLSPFIDFAIPTPAETALQRIANLSLAAKVMRWIRIAGIAVIASFLALLPAYLWVDTQRDEWRIVAQIGIFAVPMTAVIVGFSSTAVRGVWRYRKSDGLPERARD